MIVDAIKQFGLRAQENRLFIKSKVKKKRNVNYSDKSIRN